MNDAPTIHEIEAIAFKRQVLGVSALESLCAESVQLESLPYVVDSLLSKINTVNSCTGASKLKEVSTGAYPYFQDLLAAPARELREGVDARLVFVAMLLDLFKICSGMLGGRGNGRPATRLLPIIANGLGSLHCTRLLARQTCSSRFTVRYGCFPRGERSKDPAGQLSDVHSIIE